MNRILLALLIVIASMTGCTSSSQEMEPKNNEQNAINEDFRIDAGRIVEKTIRWENRYLILLIPNLAKEEIMTKTRNQLIEDNREQDIAYYFVDEKLYNTLEIGQQVRVKAELDQLEPYPPIRSVIELEILE
ncbi:YobA family protein [Paenibacillus sp. SC116]|uniref:YobA family protein n=1 Tax=Paenibacillus sp. SC116 TaxID=2968986 RepID=UPI00215A2AA9|nr:YobA family protein [Paenibacillus sp. SC116]MCR8846415.1 YobA family protein [Paenibacillus sp. SC116]